MNIELILTIHGYLIALIFLITVYFWIACKNRGIIELYKRPLTIGLILGLGLPLLLGSLHYFLSKTVTLLIKYGLFCLVSLNLFVFSLINFRNNKKKVVRESKEFMNLRKRPLVKPLPPTKEKIKQQLMKFFIKPQLDNLALIKRENQKEHGKAMRKVRDEQEKIKDKFEDLREKEDEINRRLKELDRKSKQVQAHKNEVKLNLTELKSELNHTQNSKKFIEDEKEKLELKKLRIEKDSDRIKRKLQDLLMFEEELEKEKGEFKKARKQADSIIKIKKKIDAKIKEYNSKLKIFVQEKNKLDKDMRSLEARQERLDDEWDDIKDERAWVNKQKSKIKRGYEKLGERKRKLQIFEDKLADKRDDLELEKGKLENLRSSLTKAENEIEILKGDSKLKDEEIKALKGRIKRK